MVNFESDITQCKFTFAYKGTPNFSPPTEVHLPLTIVKTMVTFRATPMMALKNRYSLWVNLHWLIPSIMLTGMYWCCSSFLLIQDLACASFVGEFFSPIKRQLVTETHSIFKCFIPGVCNWYTTHSIAIWPLTEFSRQKNNLACNAGVQLWKPSVSQKS